MRYVASVGSQQHTVALQENGHMRQVSLDDRDLTLDWRLIGAERPHTSTPGDVRADHFSLLVGERSYEAYARLVENAEDSEGSGLTVEVMIGGRPYVVHIRDERSQELASLAGGGHAAGDVAIRAPMPGLVVNVLVAEGAEVTRGQTVVVLEAMKMENDLAAPRTGVVRAIRASKGQTVNQGDALAVIGDLAGTSPAADEDEE
ncbi:MAG TPA: biotin/lipoyl-containing protein [Ktedonobacterales bacterium]|nr:biotin/lipoyl-containing protein [Ktedonobacterales bacterium]